jgi:hypothetical protein
VREKKRRIIFEVLIDPVPYPIQSSCAESYRTFTRKVFSPFWLASLAEKFSSLGVFLILLQIFRLPDDIKFWGSLGSGPRAFVWPSAPSLHVPSTY